MVDAAVPAGWDGSCDSVDDDCDGSVDEDAVESCSPGTWTFTLEPVADTHLVSWHDNQNLGSDPLVVVQGESSDLNIAGLMHFSSPAIQNAVQGNALVSATLELGIDRQMYGWTTSGITLHHMLQPWTHYGATWECADDYDHTPAGADTNDCDPADLWFLHQWQPQPRPFNTTPFTVQTIPGGSQGSVVGVDVREGVNDALAGGDDFGWLIAIDDQDDGPKLKVHSSESGVPPRLVLVVDPPGGPCTPTGEPETACDGVDDDCDGASDEDHSGSATSCGEGSCAAAGTMACVDGSLQDLCTPGTPAADDTTCDGVDDDCNGLTDDGAVTTCATRETRITLQVDADTTIKGTAPTANFGAGADLELRGAVDEPTALALVRFDEPAIQAALGSGSLQSATLQLETTWQHADWVNHEVSAFRMLMPWSESAATWMCAADTDLTGPGEFTNDCDPANDWGFEYWWDGPSPYDTTAVASVVLPTGHSGAFQLDVTSSVQASLADGNHNGWLLTVPDALSVDPEVTFGTRESGQPALLVLQVVGAGSAGCTPTGQSEASCNGIDDDCDGQADEDYAPTLTSCGTGACASTGALECNFGSESDNCTPGTAALDDITCDGIDDDCDGQVDNGYPVTVTYCGAGACAAQGELSCSGGTVVNNCTPVVNCEGLCADGLDDDSDGDMDCADSDCAGQPECVLGNACSADADCNPMGGTPTCVDEATTGVPGGYCSRLCGAPPNVPRGPWLPPPNVPRGPWWPRWQPSRASRLGRRPRCHLVVTSFELIVGERLVRTPTEDGETPASKRIVTMKHDEGAIAGGRGRPGCLRARLAGTFRRRRTMRSVPTR